MMAEGFLANGATVYLAGRSSKDLDAAVSSLSHLGPVHAVPANLQDLSACKALVAALPASGLHVLVNNAGAAWGEELDTYPDDAWTKVLTLNLQRAFTLTQLCLPLMEKVATPEDPARVIHIGSIDGIRAPVVQNFAYSASKAGLHQLSHHLARELGPRHVTSNVIACGPFETKMMKGTLDAMGDHIRAELPLRRIGQPEDVAGTALFLSSRAGAFCNGALIRVDGGASLVSKL